MSTPEDHAICDVLWDRWAVKLESGKEVVACSANDIQISSLRKILPNSRIKNLTREKWDLNAAHAIPPVDLVVACNVFHYSPNPRLWFINVLSVCKYFWIQDLFIRQRGLSLELGEDGDATRYTFGGVRLGSHPTFDLSELGDKLEDFHCYDAGSKRNGRILINFAACIRGDIK